MTDCLPSLLDAVDEARERLVGGPALFALDFDGTLTEIVDDPDAPRLGPERRSTLARVPASDRWLAVVSGRALDDLVPRVGIEPAIYVGNHGLEVAGESVGWRSPEAEQIEERLHGILGRLPPLTGVTVEDKGLTATVHVRPREDRERHRAAGEALRRAVEDAGFALRAGKASWEIRPRDGRNKGEALRHLLEVLPGASEARTLYVGDDATDEDAFRALPGGLTARVGPSDAETAAGHHLPSPAAVYRFLERVLGA